MDEYDIDVLYGWPDTHFTEFGSFRAARAVGLWLSEISEIGFSQELLSEFRNDTQYDFRNLECPD